jgi:HAD superfamily hydrolase (TIGR01549 family)
MKMYEMIFFDFYGTLVEEDDDCIQLVISNLIENSENRFTPDEVLTLWNQEFKRLMQYANENTFLTIKEIEIQCIEMLAEKMESKIDIKDEAEIIFQCWRNPKPKRGIKKILSNLSCRYMIVSNADDAEIGQAIEKFNFCPNAIITSEGTKSYKPDKRIFHYALEKCKVTPSKVLFIGDSYSSDIMGAYYTGIDSLWLNWRNSQKQERHYKYSSNEINEMEKELKRLRVIEITSTSS